MTKRSKNTSGQRIGKDGLTKHQRYIRKNRAAINEKNAKRNKENRLRRKITPPALPIASSDGISSRSEENRLRRKREAAAINPVLAIETPSTETSPMPEIPFASSDDMPEIPVASSDDMPEIPVASSDDMPEIPVASYDDEPAINSEDEEASHVADLHQKILDWADSFFVSASNNSEGYGRTIPMRTSRLRAIRSEGFQLVEDVHKFLYCLPRDPTDRARRMLWIVEMVQTLSFGTGILSVAMDNGLGRSGARTSRTVDGNDLEHFSVPLAQFPTFWSTPEFVNEKWTQRICSLRVVLAHLAGLVKAKIEAEEAWKKNCRRRHGSPQKLEAMAALKKATEDLEKARVELQSGVQAASSVDPTSSSSASAPQEEMPAETQPTVSPDLPGFGTEMDVEPTAPQQAVDGKSAQLLDLGPPAVVHPSLSTDSTGFDAEMNFEETSSQTSSSEDLTNIDSDMSVEPTSSQTVEKPTAEHEEEQHGRAVPQQPVQSASAAVPIDGRILQPEQALKMVIEPKSSDAVVIARINGEGRAKTKRRAFNSCKAASMAREDVTGAYTHFNMVTSNAPPQSQSQDEAKGVQLLQDARYAFPTVSFEDQRMDYMEGVEKELKQDIQETPTEMKEEVNTGTEDEAKPKKRRQQKRDAASDNFWEMDEDTQKAEQEAGRKAIRLFLVDKANREKFITPRLRKMARRYQAFLPEAATYSREVALAFFHTNYNNTKCIFHENNRHPGASEADNINLTGIGHSSTMRSKICSDPGPQVPGHLSCGCAEDEALYGFYLWKTCKAKSSNVDLPYTYSMDGDYDNRLSPRTRSFWNSSLKDISGLSIDDLYGGWDWGTPAYKANIAMLQFVVQQQRLHDAGIHLAVVCASEGVFDLFEATTKKRTGVSPPQLLVTPLNPIPSIDLNPPIDPALLVAQ
ncbi:hypothetical protein BDZ97DRAFT_1765623 [Flammula alnicola]|nr:hypothetical protein BDZ97DRAFT_1765623 [Flammula alnicola]